jgi:hypothetical protein
MGVFSTTTYAPGIFLPSTARNVYPEDKGKDGSEDLMVVLW